MIMALKTRRNGSNCIEMAVNDANYIEERQKMQQPMTRMHWRKEKMQQPMTRITLKKRRICGAKK